MHRPSQTISDQRSPAHEPHLLPFRTDIENAPAESEWMGGWASYSRPDQFDCSIVRNPWFAHHMPTPVRGSLAAFSAPPMPVAHRRDHSQPQGAWTARLRGFWLLGTSWWGAGRIEGFGFLSLTPPCPGPILGLGNSSPVRHRKMIRGNATGDCNRRSGQVSWASSPLKFWIFGRCVQAGRDRCNAF